MHYTQILLKNGRKPAVPPFPFKEMLPLSLKDKVSGRLDQSSSAPCLQEMSMLLACLKDKEFAQTLCDQEIRAFQKCADNYTAARQRRDALDQLGVAVPGAKRLTTKQLNRLLAQYPQPKSHNK